MMLRNHYGVDMGTGGLIIQAQSREEILADKLVAFALRPNRLKNRDLWDIAWLHQQGVVLLLELLPKKLSDHRCELQRFLGLLADRQNVLLTEPKMHTEFQTEMRRFLPTALVMETVDSPDFWSYLSSLIVLECQRAHDYLVKAKPAGRFRM